MNMEEIYQSIEHIAKCEMYDAIEVKYLKSKFKELQQENKQLKDNWNKLKEYIGTEWYTYDNDSVEFEVAKDILDKIEEMIGGDI